MTDGKHIPQDELALYAMQALTPAEAAEVGAHVRTCAECREELARAQGDLALVAMSVEQAAAPKGARARFLERVAADAAQVGGEEQRYVRATVRGPVTAMPVRRARWTGWVAWGAVAALLVLAVGLEMRVRSLDEQLRQQAGLIEEQKASNAKAQMVMELLSAPSAQHVTLVAAKSKPAPTAKTVYMASHGALLMQASNLEPLPGNKTYELWVIPMKGAPVPAGMFRPDAAGNASVVMLDLPKGMEAKAFGVTVENAGGASTPTMPIVLAGAPSSGE
jgi:anti-sigma-K factor RskA